MIIIFLNIVLLVILILTTINGQFVLNQECFFKNNDAVDISECNNRSIDVFNNEAVYPLLRKLLQRDFFKFYKVFCFIFFLINNF